jgi:hypothetical protein
MRRVGAEHYTDVESLQVHRFDHVHRRAMVLPFAPAEFLVSFFSPRPANSDVFLTAGKVRSNRNRPLADLPQPPSWLRRPRTVFDKFRFEIAEPKIFRFDHVNVGIDHFKPLLGH